MQELPPRLKTEVTFEKIKTHKTLVERIVEDLEQKILDESLKPGQRINETEFCEKMGISRSPLREALRILESQGFLVRAPRRGLSVATFTFEEARDIYQIRANLESLAVYLAVEKNDPEVLGTLIALHEKMKSIGFEGDPWAYFHLNEQFHGILVQASANRRLIDLITTFEKQTRRYRIKVLGLPGKIETSIKNHEAIIRSFQEGNAEQAERWRKKAILDNISILFRYYGEENHENRS